MSVLLDLQNLETRFKTREGWVYASNGTSLQVRENETLCIVGESGCGKSVSMMSILGLIPMPPGKITGGSAQFKGRDLLQCGDKELQKIRGKEIGMIFQDPMTSFNPVLTVGKQLVEPLIEHQGMKKKDAWAKGIEMLELVGIPNAEQRMKDYPHEYSGGMRQRAMIAMALICQPELLIADEPTTALDVTIQAQIVELVNKLKAESDMSVIWITHDLGVVASIADRVCVLYGGRVVEEADVNSLYDNPQHPYTRGLLGSLPKDGDKSPLKAVPGSPSMLREPLKGCPFYTRCEESSPQCQNEIPPMKSISSEHKVACFKGVSRV